MVAEGSAGVFRDEKEILDRLPYAKGLQYIQLFWVKHDIYVSNKARSQVYESANMIL